MQRGDPALERATSAEPVSAAMLAARTGLLPAEAAAFIDRLRGAYRDDEGRVIGMWGLAVTEFPPHRCRIDGRKLFTWCAWDPFILTDWLSGSAQGVLGGRPHEGAGRVPSRGRRSGGPVASWVGGVVQTGRRVDQRRDRQLLPLRALLHRRAIRPGVGPTPVPARSCCRWAMRSHSVRCGGDRCSPTWTPATNLNTADPPRRAPRSRQPVRCRPSVFVASSEDAAWSPRGDAALDDIIQDKTGGHPTGGAAGGCWTPGLRSRRNREPPRAAAWPLLTAARPARSGQLSLADSRSRTVQLPTAASLVSRNSRANAMKASARGSTTR